MMKRYVMEFVGTFFLTVAISLMANPIAIGLMLMAMIYVGGHVSGAHFNPAVSFVCLVQNRLDFAGMMKYIAAQTLGACLGLCVFGMITSGTFGLDIVPGSPIFGPMVIEALFALVLAWVYVTMNLMNRYKDTAIPGVVLGLTLMMIAFAGGLFNPAVAMASIACNIVQGGEMAAGMGGVLVYIVGPMLGAFGASFMFDYFKSEI